MRQILINDEGLETRVAVVQDGKLVDYFIERKGEQQLVGSVFKGVIRNLEPSLQAAFVDIGAEKNAFLHYWDMLPASRDKLEQVFDNDEDVDTPSSDDLKKPETKARKTLLNLRRKLFKHEEEAKNDTSDNKKPRGRGNRSRRGRRNSTPSCTVEDIPDLFPVQSEVIVQVTKGPIGTKGARVTTNLSVAGRYLVLLPNSGYVGLSKKIDNKSERDRLRKILTKRKMPKGMGVICRTVGAGKKEEVFEADLDNLLRQWGEANNKIKNTKAPCCVYQEPTLIERCLRDYLTESIDEIVADSKETFDRAISIIRNLSRGERVKVRHYKSVQPIFDKYRLRNQIENIFRRQVTLPSGGYLCIDETEALTAIDVNSGKNREGKDHPETILRTNMEAIEEIARQLKIRNIGGIIVLDLIDMRSKKDIHTVYSTLKKHLTEDRAKTKVCPISPLGLVEMTRQREHESLLDTVYSPCPYCDGKGLVKSTTSVSVEIQRKLQGLLRRRRKAQIRVMVNPRVLERLKNEDADLLRQMESDLGGELSFRPDPELHVEEFHILDAETGNEM
jgi:Rne/Rng family ribonuclease